MAALSDTNLTMADWAKRVDPDGSIAVVVEMLSRLDPAIQDIVYKQGNLPTGDQFTVRTALPEVHWRIINQGTAPSKSATAQAIETCGMLEARSEIDVKLANLNGNTKAFRFSEDTAFMEAMTQELGSTLFYGNSLTNPEEFNGLAPRYNSLSGGNAQNILSAGGSGSDNTSIWLVYWGDQSVYCPFPKGSTSVGLTHRDLGEQMIQTSDGRRMQALCSLFNWDIGLAVKDWRGVVRIPNVDISDLVAQANTQASTAATAIIKLMSRALDRIPKTGMGRPCFYMNRTVFSFLKIAALDKSSSVLSIQSALSQFGNSPIETLSFLNVPIRCTDALVNTEAAVA